MNALQQKLIMEPTLERQFDIEQQLIDTDSYGRPVIVGTGITVEAILSKLAAGWFLGDIMEAYEFPNDKPILAAFAYAASLPLQHPLATKLHQYREHLKQKVRGILTELKQCFKVLYGSRLVQIVLFGSQARGEPNPGSDIDVLVVLREPVNFEIEDKLLSEVVAELSLRYTEVINCILINENDFQYSQEPLLRNVRLEGIVI